jgi:hypothetical protein
MQQGCQKCHKNFNRIILNDLSSKLELNFGEFLIRLNHVRQNQDDFQIFRHDSKYFDITSKSQMFVECELVKPGFLGSTIRQSWHFFIQQLHPVRTQSVQQISEIIFFFPTTWRHVPCNFLSKLCTEEFANNSFDDDHDGEGVRENDGSEAVTRIIPFQTLEYK